MRLLQKSCPELGNLQAMGSLVLLTLPSGLLLEPKSWASTTPKWKIQKRALNPGKCYYIQNNPWLGKDGQLDQDPPCDLVVEVDITHTDTTRMLYRMGIPGVLAPCDGKDYPIYQPKGEDQVVKTSPTFSLGAEGGPHRFPEQCSLGEA